MLCCVWRTVVCCCHSMLARTYPTSGCLSTRKVLHAYIRASQPACSMPHQEDLTGISDRSTCYYPVCRATAVPKAILLASHSQSSSLSLQSASRLGALPGAAASLCMLCLATGLAVQALSCTAWLWSSAVPDSTSLSAVGFSMLSAYRHAHKSVDIHVADLPSGTE